MTEQERRTAFSTETLMGTISSFSQPPHGSKNLLEFVGEDGVLLGGIDAKGKPFGSLEGFRVETGKLEDEPGRFDITIIRPIFSDTVETKES